MNMGKIATLAALGAVALTAGAGNAGASDPGNADTTIVSLDGHPPATGNGWSIFSTTDGVNFTPVDSGSYTLGDAEAARNPHEGPPAVPAVQK